MKSWLPYTAIVCISACGGGSRTSPTSPTSGPSAPTNLRTDFTPALGRAALTLSWSGSGPFTVEVGRTSGASDIGVFQVDGSSFVTNNLPTGRVFFRVRTGDSTGPSSSELTAVVFDLREYIESLFFGTGPLIPTDGNFGCGARSGVMRGFPKGSSVPLIVSTTLSDVRPLIEGFAADVATLTRGRTTVAVSVTGNADPRPERGQVTIASGDPASIGCGSTDGGCSLITYISSPPGVYSFGRILVKPTTNRPEVTARHELAHMLLGLCHVDAGAIGSSTGSLMTAGPQRTASADTLSAYDRAAIDAVFTAGMEPGRTRADFSAAGLIR